MDLGDVKILGAALFLFLLFNFSTGLIPWSWVFGLTTIIGGAIGLYKWDEGGLGTGRKTAQISPLEAPRRLNQKVAPVPGYRRINIDHTDDEHKDFRTTTRWVEINGVEHKMYAIVGRPPNPDTREILAYIYDLSEDEIVDYSGEIYDPTRRIRPFEGKNDWLIIEGKSVNREGVDSGGQITINQASPQNTQSEG